MVAATSTGPGDVELYPVVVFERREDGVGKRDGTVISGNRVADFVLEEDDVELYPVVVPGRREGRDENRDGTISMEEERVVSVWKA